MREILFATRRLLKNPLQLSAGLLAFMLGIGLNTAMFSIADALMFRPLELPELNRLILLESYAQGTQMGIDDVSPADFKDFHTSAKSVESMGFGEGWSATITRDAEPDFVSAERVSSNWFDILGSTMVLGRGFLPGEDQLGKNRVVVISHGLWARRYASDPRIIGRQMRLNNEDYEVVGVVKQTARYPGYIEVFSPYPRTPQFEQLRETFNLMVVARLKPDVSLSEASAEIATLQAGIVSRYKASHDGRRVQAVLMSDRVAGTNDLGVRFTRMLLYATAFALLIACANVANLQFARVSGRAREFAIMRAIGAGRWPIARQVLIESLLLAGGGAILGALVSIWSVDLIKGLLPTEVWQFIPMWPYVKVNGFAVLITSLLALAAGLISGVAPAFQSSRVDAQESLREGGRAMTSGGSRQWFRGALVAFQMMLALVLLIGAGLMVRGANASINMFGSRNPEQVATMQLVLPETRYESRAQRLEFSRKLEQELNRLPGVESMALVNYLPLSDSGSSVGYYIEGRPMPPVSERPRALNQVVTPGYFKMMQIPLKQGRFLTSEDFDGREAVCVVDETFANASLANQNPLGQRIVQTFLDAISTCRIVGVVGGQMHFAWENTPRKTVYKQNAQVGSRTLAIMLRTSGPVASLLAAARKAVSAVDPDQPVRKAFSYQKLIETTLGGLRMVAIFMTGIGLVAMLLACLGIYSVMSYTVSERTSEIGMRVAMGAQPSDIFRLLGYQALIMVGTGMLLGLVLGYGLARFFSGLVFGVNPNDFWSLASVSILLAVVAALAMYIPARRAIQMDPATALRHD